MIVIKTVIGLCIIMMSLITLYVIGRITMPIMDPNWRLFGTPHYIMIMLAGIVGIATVGFIGMMCVLGYALGEVVTSALQ